MERIKKPKLIDFPMGENVYEDIKTILELGWTARPIRPPKEIRGKKIGKMSDFEKGLYTLGLIYKIKGARIYKATEKDGDIEDLINNDQLLTLGVRMDAVKQMLDGAIKERFILQKRIAFTGIIFDRKFTIRLFKPPKLKAPPMFMIGMLPGMMPDMETMEGMMNLKNEVPGKGDDFTGYI